MFMSSGQEVATYCATHLPDIIRSCYSNRDLGQAMKDAFMKCDRIVMEPDAIMEMRTYNDKDEVSPDEYVYQYVSIFPYNSFLHYFYITFLFTGIIALF